MRVLTTASLILATSFTALPSAAAESKLMAAFTAAQRELITSYARNNGTVLVEQEKQAQPADDDKGKGHGNGHGRGHSKDKGLPPGIAMNLQRGKSLPPGIAKHRLPPALVKQLPPPPKGKEIVVVDGRVLLVDIATQKIHDKIENVLFR